MLALSTTTMAALGVVAALWLFGAVWALYAGLSMRRRSAFAAEQADRLALLLESAPALPVLVRADGRIEAPDRLAGWLGLESVPKFVSQLTEAEGGLEPKDGQTLAHDISAAQKAGKSFTRPVSAQGSSRALLVRGSPAGPALSSPGGVILWLFDATESQVEIAALTEEKDRLARALESLAGVIEAAPMPMWHRSPDLRLSLVNSAYVQSVDASDAQEVILNGMELVEPIEGVSPMAAAATALESGVSYARLVPATIDGERRMMRVVDVPLGEAGVAGYAIDMHELEQARSEYKRLAEAQRDMLDRLSAGVAQFGADRSLRFSNQPFQRLFGLRSESLSDAPEFDRVLDSMREAGRLPGSRDFPAWRTERRDWFLSTQAIEENWLLPDGVHLRVFAQPLPDGGLLLIFEDRTEQVQLSSARDTLLRVRAATFDNLFEAVGVFASDGRLHLWNNRFKKIWGFEENALAEHPRVDQMMEKVAYKLLKPDQISVVRELVRSATVERKQRGGRVAFADGQHFEFAAIPLPDGNALFTMLDVTDSRRIEQALRDRNSALEEADQIKTAFVSNMSYELRTPLTSIAGFTEMLQAGYAGELPDQARDYIGAIMESVARLSSLIDNVLDLTQGEAGALPLHMRPLDLAELIQERAGHYQDEAKGREIELAVKIDDSLGSVSGDSRRLGEAIDHLLANAIRYTGSGGRVLLHGDGTPQGARIVVSDNGPGMDVKAQALAFDRFKRAEQAKKGEPLGFGLPLARQLVEAHGGTLNLMSELGQGTAITMELPRG
ncbi:PAS domain-containing sensor histidine kinase [Rhizorhapis suberifaciens]|uniref:histidine kinase n=1 Tax=Rhizorhapis suberifaciens TaxID=13656 RepID=A0A840HVN0_9SPHN|nr:PAS domain-containing sensor histidine kinase [Rhizorhapis suberifaciens]MBB4641630.1 signal transduction histidine kinase [Rhizorhapis suberifaciens]